MLPVSSWNFRRTLRMKSSVSSANFLPLGVKLSIIKLLKAMMETSKPVQQPSPTIWVGGQFTVAGLLPTIRSLGEDAPKQVARAFARLLWPAYAVLLVTGFWNISAVQPKNATSAWNAVAARSNMILAYAAYSKGTPSGFSKSGVTSTTWLCSAA